MCCACCTKALHCDDDGPAGAVITLTLSPWLRQSNADTAALLELFLAYAARETERGRVNGRRLIVDPMRLREALAAFQRSCVPHWWVTGHVSFSTLLLCWFIERFPGMVLHAVSLQLLVTLNPHTVAL